MLIKELFHFYLKMTGTPPLFLFYFHFFSSVPAFNSKFVFFLKKVDGALKIAAA
jgi:hypothetical protein